MFRLFRRRDKTNYRDQITEIGKKYLLTKGYLEYDLIDFKFKIFADIRTMNGLGEIGVCIDVVHIPSDSRQMEILYSSLTKHTFKQYESIMLTSIDRLLKRIDGKKHE